MSNRLQLLDTKRVTMIKCAKCGDLFDPRHQAAYCRGRGHAIRHHKTMYVEMPEFETQKQKAEMPKQAPFQSDFRLLWNDDL